MKSPKEKANLRARESVMRDGRVWIWRCKLGGQIGEEARMKVAVCMGGGGGEPKGPPERVWRPRDATSAVRCASTAHSHAGPAPAARARPPWLVRRDPGVYITIILCSFITCQA